MLWCFLFFFCNIIKKILFLSNSQKEEDCETGEQLTGLKHYKVSKITGTSWSSILKPKRLNV